MDIKLFEDTIKRIDKNKYHISRSLRFTSENKPYIDEWTIFRKDMPTVEYFSKNNKAILSSKNGDTIEDIKKIIGSDYTNEK